MNFKRGLLRLWILGSAIFLVIVAASSYNDIRIEFEAERTLELARQDERAALEAAIIAPEPKCESPANVLARYDPAIKLALHLGAKVEGFQVPVPCTEARGDFQKDYTNDDAFCNYKLEDFRRLYPEYRPLNDATVLKVFFGEAQKHLYRKRANGIHCDLSRGWPS